MASTSISSIQKSFKYDLFISFRGKDTRKNFVAHLYDALQRKGIHTFKDDTRLKKGKKIDNELIKAIEDSKFFIIVFSKNYASSSWCLDELVKIIECHKTTQQTAFPLFYDVEPTEVRKQSGVFGEVFAKHKFEESFGKWREALKEAGDMSGWELKKTADGHETEFIQKVVKEMFLELRSINFSVDEKLVGMESRIKDVELLLDTGFDDVRMIGIKGIGGGGKTTLARALFEKISCHFEGNSFVENVREVSQASLTGLKSLQKQVLSDVLNDKDIIVNSVYEGKKMIKKMLSSRKVLLILDDIDHIQQLEALAGESSWFMAGTRIIITTRDEQVLLAHGVNRIHGVHLLSDDEANCLFSRYAFGRDTASQGYEDLSLKVVSYVAGLPLTTKVLGSFLRGKDEREWIDALERLKTIPEKETTQILELSYMGLEDDCKEIFLNVVCFMEAWTEDDAIHVLECCGFYARTGLKILQRKSLITFSQDDFDRDCIHVHDLIKEMGRNIVRRFNPDEPSTHSRLWISKEIEDILANDLGTDATRYIYLEQHGFSAENFMKGFGNMKRLIYLNITIHVKDDCFSDDGDPFEYGNSSNYMNIDQVREYFPNSLRYLQWDGYQHCCLPKLFRANNLVALRMRGSRVEKLWEKGVIQVMKKLKFLDFTGSWLQTLDLQMIPNLEMLDLKKCGCLEELKMPSGCHLKLKSLHISQSTFKTLDLRMAENLETLDLNSSRYLVMLNLPVTCQKLTSLNLSYLPNLRELNLGSFPNLEEFYFAKCHELFEFHMPFGCLKLKFLTLHFSTFTTLDLRLSPNLEKLCLEKCNLVEFQALINGCPKLKSLKIINSDLKTLDLGVAQKLEELYLENCPNLVEFFTPISCQKLRSLDLSLSKLRTLELGLNPCLQNIRLAQCRDLLELHMPVGCPALVTLFISQCYDLVKFHMSNGCPNLRNLYLRHSKLRTLDLQPTPNLEVLDLQVCDKLVELQTPVNGFPNLANLYLRNLKLRTLDLRLTPNLDRLHLEECDELLDLHMPVNGCLKLTYLYVRRIKLRTLDLRLAADLYSLDIIDCHNLLALHIDRCLKLTRLYLRHLKLRTFDLQLTPNVKELNLQECYELVELHIPVNGCAKLTKLYLRHLKLTTFNLRLTPELQSLDIENCHDLAQLHMPDRFTKLTSLNLCHCMLRNLDHVMAPNLEKFHIEECHDKVQHKSFDLVKRLESRAFRLTAFLPSFRFSFLYEEQEQPSSTTINLQKLVSLANCCFRNSMSFSESICGLQNLRDLTLYGRIPEMPEYLEQLEYLEELVLSYIRFKHLPDSICMLKRLKSFKLESCLLEKLPEDIGQLEYLEELILTDCYSLTEIPVSICKMKRLKRFSLAGCNGLEKLPEELGGLEGLEELNVERTRINQLPNSICMLQHLKYLILEFCTRVEKLPEELGGLKGLKGLKMLNVEGTAIRRLPKGIALLKGLRVVGFQIPEIESGETFCCFPKTKKKNV